MRKRESRKGRRNEIGRRRKEKRMGKRNVIGMRRSENRTGRMNESERRRRKMEVMLGEGMEEVRGMGRDRRRDESGDG